MATHEEQAAAHRQAEKKKQMDARREAGEQAVAEGRARQQQAVDDFNALRANAKPVPTPEEIDRAKVGGIKPGETDKEPSGTEGFAAQQAPGAVMRETKEGEPAKARQVEHKK